jgi:hypothetical protein
MGIGRINKWVRGSIIEPVVAIVILVTTIAMAFSILSRVNIVPSIMALNKANEMINNEVFLVYTQKDFLDKEIKDGAFLLEKKVNLVDKTSIILVKINVFDATNKLIASKTVQLFDNETKPKEIEENAE